MPTLADALQSLGLRHTATHLDDIVALATKRRWSPTQLLEHLAELELQERTRRSLERRLARSRLGRFTPMSAFDWAWPTRIDRPAVEEIGSLPSAARAADLFFQVVSRRYERKSLVLTTNLPFSEWPTIFPNAATATALIDRVVHHAEILTIEGESYRRRVAEATRRPSRASA